MGIDHNGFARFAESAIVGIFSGDNYSNAHEDAGAAARVVQVTLRHDDSMLRQLWNIVNTAVYAMFPHCNLAHPGGAKTSGTGFSPRRSVPGERETVGRLWICLDKTPQAKARATFPDARRWVTRYDFPM